MDRVPTFIPLRRHRPPPPSSCHAAALAVEVTQEVFGIYSHVYTRLTLTDLDGGAQRSSALTRFPTGSSVSEAK